MQLSAKITSRPAGQSFVGRITLNKELPEPLRGNEILLIDGAGCEDLTGFRAVFSADGGLEANGVIPLPPALAYLKEGDILRVNYASGDLRVLYRRDSRHNVLFFTERCNSRCLMCSQPPRDIEDDWLIDEILESLPLMSLDTPVLCITGGEPTLSGARFVEVIKAVKVLLPNTALHVLSNGKSFAHLKTAQAIADTAHPDLMIGIPLYSDVASIHDFVVQSKGSFSLTVMGMMNLARCGVPVECRFVIHRQTVSRMPETALFIARNLPFVQHVALMGLEMTGYTRSNLEALWIDPYDYRDLLVEAVDALRVAGIRVLIYNLPLCVVPRELWPFAVQSISDWKNIFPPECDGCTVRHLCGGFFASSDLRRTAHIQPIFELVQGEVTTAAI